MTQSLPHHLAIIMDGNGRWAELRKQTRDTGHAAGVKAVRNTVEVCLAKGIEVLSLFALSSENLQRSSKELENLFNIYLEVINADAEALHQAGVKVRFIGNRAVLNKELLTGMSMLEQLTESNSKLQLLIAMNYSGQWDIVNAINQVQEHMRLHQLSHCTSKLLDQYLATSTLPAPDLLIRTSGELRLSNFYLWQLAYTELYFTDTLWPDFNTKELNQALLNYQSRQRRYGLTTAREK